LTPDGKIVAEQPTATPTLTRPTEPPSETPTLTRPSEPPTATPTLTRPSEPPKLDPGLTQPKPSEPPKLDPGLTPPKPSDPQRPKLDQGPRLPGGVDRPRVELPDWRVLGLDHRASFSELDSSQPLLLLPVRLETRFEQRDLKIRVYPDQIHLDEHEPLLTADEQTYGRRFWRHRLAAADQPTRREGEAWFAAHVPARRAAYVARQTRPKIAESGAPVCPKLALREAASPRRAAALPDRWAAIGYCQGAELSVQFAASIPAELACAPRLEDATAWSKGEGALPIDEAVAWMVDYDEARRVGMGLTVSLDATEYARVQQHGLNLLVVGVRGEAPQVAAQTLEGLLRAHLYTDGLELVPQGTPTNNTDERAAGWTEEVDDLEDLFARELDGAEAGTDPGADAGRLSTALGVRPALLARVRNGNVAEDGSMAAMNRALWPVTWGRYFDDLLATVAEAREDPADQVSILPAAAIAYTREFFVEQVRGGAPLPTLAIGSQPYGVLPVRRTREGLGLRRPADMLEWVLIDLKARWRASLPEVPRLDPVVGDRIGSDPKDDAVVILGSLPHPKRFAVRRLAYLRGFLEILPEYLFGGGFVRDNPACSAWVGWYLGQLEDVDNIAEQLDLIDRWQGRIRHDIADPAKRTLAEGWVEVLRALASGHAARQQPLDRLAAAYYHGAFCVDRMLQKYPPTMDDPKLLWSFFSRQPEDRTWNRPLVQAAGARGGATAAGYLDALAERLPRTFKPQPRPRMTSLGQPLSDRLSASMSAPSTSTSPSPSPSPELLADPPLLYQLLDSLKLPDDIPTDQRGSMRQALELLATLGEQDVERLELRMRETLGLASHRL